MAYAAPQRYRLGVLGGLVETTYGTLNAPTVALAKTPTYNVSMEPGALLVPRGPNTDSLSATPAVPGTRAGRLTFDTFLSGGDYTPNMLAACGYYSATLPAGTLYPSSDMATQACFSFRQWVGGIGTVMPHIKTLHGCNGNMTMSIRPNSFISCGWEFDGIWNAVTDAVALVVPAVQDHNPYVTVGATTLNLGGVAMNLPQEIVIRTGNSIQPRWDMTTATGIGHFYIADRNPTIDLLVESRLVATTDDYGARLLSAGEQAISIVFPTATGHTLTIAAPKAQYMGVTEEENGGIRMRRISLQCNRSAAAGEDELTFVFT